MLPPIRIFDETDEAVLARLQVDGEDAPDARRLQGQAGNGREGQARSRMELGVEGPLEAVGQAHHLELVRQLPRVDHPEDGAPCVEDRHVLEAVLAHRHRRGWRRRRQPVRAGPAPRAPDEGDSYERHPVPPPGRQPHRVSVTVAVNTSWYSGSGASRV